MKSFPQDCSHRSHRRDANVSMQDLTPFRAPFRGTIVRKTNPSSFLRAISFTAALVLAMLVASSSDVLAAESAGSTAATKQELIEIMKTVNFVPQIGKDDPFCKALYEDFRKQTNIEHTAPIVKVEKYDDPALKPYRDKCPKLDFRRSLSHWATDAHSWTDEEWEAMGIPSFGVGNFYLYRANVDPHVSDGYIFYYEGQRTIDRRLPVGGPMTEKEVVSPETRGYHFLNFETCKLNQLIFNQLGSAKWTRNGIARYKDKSGIFVLRATRTEQPIYDSFEFYAYSERLTRIAPICTFGQSR